MVCRHCWRQDIPADTKQIVTENMYCSVKLRCMCEGIRLYDFKRILINNFGGLWEKDIELTSGVNVLYGLKETEMNIVFIFVKSMFFGVPEEMQEKNGIYEKAGTEASREKYGGTIWFQHDGKDYRLMREIGAGIHNCELFCEDTREILNGENGALERILGGFSENLFDNTVMVEALGGSSSREMAKELQNKLAVLSKSGDGLVDLGRTEQMLKMWRKGYLTQKERGRKAVQREQEKLSEKLESLQNDLDGLRDQKGQVVQAQAKIYSAAGKEEATVIEEQLQTIEKKNLGMVIAGILAVIVGIIGIVGRFQLTDEMSKIGMDVCIIAAVVAMVYTLTARRKLHMEFVKLKKKKVYLQSQQEKLKSSKEDIDGIYGEKLTAFTNLQSEYQEFELEMSLPTSEDLETQSLNLAMDTIKELSRSIYLEKGRKIRIRASQIFRELTDGKYIEFYGDEGQSLELCLEEGTVLAENLEKENLEMLYFSIQMAAAELFTNETVFPVILDDIFHGKNQDKLMAVFRWLKKQPRQVLLFTNNKDMADIF